MAATIKLSALATRQFWEIPVLFEDASLLALDKPAGLALTPEPDEPERPDLLGLMHRAIQEGKPWAAERGLSFLMSAQRIDSDASGAVLFAKEKSILSKVADLLGAEKPVVRYVALTRGNAKEDCWESSVKIAEDVARPGRVRVDARGGKRARTRFEVLERFSRWTLLSCEPLTHRPHQIRVHLASQGLPVVGDPLYGGKMLLLSTLKRDYRLKPNREERPLLSKLSLHLERVALPHPVTGEPLTITAPWPKDLTVAVKYLRRYATAQATMDEDGEEVGG